MRNEGRERDRDLPSGTDGHENRDRSEKTGHGSEFVGSEYIGSPNQDTGGMEGGHEGKVDTRNGAVNEKNPKKSKTAGGGKK